MRKFIMPILLGTILFALAEDNPSIRLMWDPNEETDLAGYRLHSGPASGVYTNVVELPFGRLMTNFPPVTNYAQVPPYPAIEHIDTNITIWYALTAYNTSGRESGYSTNEVCVNPDFWRTNRAEGVTSVWMRP